MSQFAESPDGGHVAMVPPEAIASRFAAEPRSVPQAERHKGTLVAINPLAEDVVELLIDAGGEIPVLPGQYFDVEFAGFPARPFAPTAPLNARTSDQLLRFHVQLRPDGRVSSELGRGIALGHRVTLTGPHGTAYFRQGLKDRLVLVSFATGFASCWSIADAALRERPDRSLLAIVGVPSVRSLYMVQALDLLASCPRARVIVVSEERQSLTPIILTGSPTDYLPLLLSRDVIYAAGPESLVAGVRDAAAVTGSAFYADAFEPACDGDDAGWVRRVFFSRRRRPGSTLPPPLPTMS